MTRIQPNTITAAVISFGVMGPSSVLSCLAFSLSPGITFFSGFMNTMKNPQSRNVISHPTGNI